MLTCYVALKYLGHPLRKQKQREPPPRTQAEHLHQQMCLEEVERGKLCMYKVFSFYWHSAYRQHRHSPFPVYLPLNTHRPRVHNISMPADG